MGRKENKVNRGEGLGLQSKVIFQNYYFCHDLFFKLTDDTVACFFQYGSTWHSRSLFITHCGEQVVRKNAQWCVFNTVLRAGRVWRCSACTAVSFTSEHTYLAYCPQLPPLFSLFRKSVWLSFLCRAKPMGLFRAGEQAINGISVSSFFIREIHVFPKAVI